jgi:hypothetical protein
VGTRTVVVGGKAARRKGEARLTCGVRVAAATRGRRRVARRVGGGAASCAGPRRGLAKQAGTGRTRQAGMSGPHGPCGLCWWGRRRWPGLGCLYWAEMANWDEGLSLAFEFNLNGSIQIKFHKIFKPTKLNSN